jgi:hypothetical protein
LSMAGSPVLIFFPLARHRGREGGVFNIEKKVSRQINLICLIKHQPKQKGETSIHRKSRSLPI